MTLSGHQLLCVYFAIWIDDRPIRVPATENHRIFSTRSSANNVI